LKRHATSKIRTAHDLERLSTMGFRGEALAALASISKLDIKTSDGIQSCHIALEGGGAPNVTKIARNRGTTVEARNLFFNTPARLKFQKSPAANSAAVLKIVQTIALAHPNVRFSLYSNGKMTLKCHQTDWKLRAEEILGPFAHVVDAPMVHGLLGRPEEGKLSRSAQTLFINRRPIFSPLIAKAVKEGFGTRMQEALFPVFLLFLELPPDWIDVNVHPQKREVRFQEESRIFQIVQSAVFQAFEGVKDAAPLPWEKVLNSQDHRHNFTMQPNTFFIPEHENNEVRGALDFTHEGGMKPDPTFRLEDAPPTLPFEETSTPLAILGDFLLMHLAQEWKIVDLKGAESRIVFEEMQDRKSQVQALLWPIEYQSSDPEELVNLLKQANIEARITGKRTIAIDAVPQNLNSTHVLKFVDLLSAPGNLKRRIAAALTKTIRSAKRCYSTSEANLIWEKLCTCKDQIYDPLGRKIVSPITQEHLTGMFE
jgi:DNA mismatch repair protein MutL